MAEPTDVIVPILQRIQGDVAEVRRDVAEVKRAQEEHGEKLDAIEGYLTYQLGITSRHDADVEALKEQIAEVKRRLKTLEDAR